ncbi:MAG TPA: class III extradiol dioxygenase subunit B-like domain-containing protein [Pseudonocardiaceae bacterium]|jgi:hypothetical protein|nr:class III extradiol dioxygenase subunit B-like domain-containing protein [Pseudonocardiaceae bacterium]
MIVRAIAVPYPPLLVPELVGGAVARTEPIRAACQRVATELVEVAEEWIAVAADPAGPARFAPPVGGTFLGYGVDVPVWLADPTDPTGGAGPDPELPLPVLIAGWLRAAAGARSVRVRLIAPDTPVAECLRLGADLAAEHAGPDPVGLLVLADGSNQHGEQAPGGVDDRAEPFDTEVAAALAKADTDTLLGLDPGLAAELGATGRAAWQVLAGVAVATGPEAWRARLEYSEAPFGVAYHVALWEPA